MNILAIDFGKKRLGIAFGDTHAGIAFPRKIMENNVKSFDRVFEICKQDDVSKIIVGLPILPRGGETQETENARVFADELEDFLVCHEQVIPVDFWDERFSYKTAGDSMKLRGIRERDYRGKIDSSAAAIFLQVYFDFHS